MPALRSFLRTGAIAAAAAIIASTATALAGYTNGDQYARTSSSYKVGYVAGALDMLAGLEQTKLLKEGQFDTEAGKVVQCMIAKHVKPSEAANTYLAYLRKNPGHTTEIAAGDIFVALRLACGT